MDGVELTGTDFSGLSSGYMTSGRDPESPWNF